ncbi:hypothetical protein PV328_009668 [Microctonus aethiopoides]|uniref:Uncharacterized protein n=1 Tax=Microctonus aethiopoides TaxID=144406 RepID=A0AA39C6A7_9HYME|nr:hypothetical protein PV328_009668 [Microctonus aethiopoides]
MGEGTLKANVLPIELGDEWGIDLNANLNSLLVRCLDSTMENGVDANGKEDRDWRLVEEQGGESWNGKHIEDGERVAASC